MPWLKDTNSHPSDGSIELIEPGHWYAYRPDAETADEDRWRVRKSVTGLLKPFFDTFDGASIVKSGVPKWLGNEEHKYHFLCQYLSRVQGLDNKAIGNEILKLWNATGAAAADEGTAMHERLELFIQGELPPPDPEKPPPLGVAAYIGMLEWFYPQMELKPWRCEFPVVLVVDDLPIVAGTIDYIMVDRNGRYWLFDWKRVNPKKKGLLGKRKLHSMFPTDKAKGPFASWDADSYNQYSAQILVYKWILEHGGYDMQIAGCHIVQMHEDLDKAHVVEVAEMDEEVDGCMRAEIELAKEEALAQVAVDAT